MYNYISKINNIYRIFLFFLGQNRIFCQMEGMEQEVSIKSVREYLKYVKFVIGIRIMQLFALFQI